jgi:two-component system, OmpR family, KDP operon response regulator KdpE
MTFMKSAQPRVMVIDDETQIRRFLRVILERDGYQVVEVSFGREAISEVALMKPDVVILDLGLPDIDGCDVLRRVREWSRVPVLVASVRDGSEDKVGALDAGADDYVTKPFDTPELLARLRAIQRRVESEPPVSHLKVGSLRIDLAAHVVTVKSREVRLTPLQYGLLRILALNAGRMITQRQLLQETWGGHSEAQARHLRVHLCHIRRKLAAAGFNVRQLRNEPGIGYRLVEEM